MKNVARATLVAAFLASTSAFAGQTYTNVKDFAFEENGVPEIVDAINGFGMGSAPLVNLGTGGAGNLSIGVNFRGTTDYDTRALGIGLIPPDTMGAVGTTQYVQLLNGSFSVYDKSTGALQAPRKTDSAFWQGFGAGATGGDPRVRFDSRSNRWLAIGFDSTGANLNIGVSETADALGAWKTSTVTGFAPGLADFPTLSISGNSIVIGTNNFTAISGSYSYSGTTVNILKYSDVFATTGPITANVQKFNTPYDSMTGGEDSGYAIQGVNRSGGGGPVKLVATSAFFADTVTYDINNPGKASASQTATQYLTDTGGTTYDANSPGRQPTTNGSARVIDTSDDRISSNAWEVGGKIYFVKTVTALGTDNTVVRLTVMDKATNTVLSETDITDPSGHFDFYQGSLAVNSSGQIVVGYNRSGSFVTGTDGRISIFARSFQTNADGTVVQTGDVMLAQSLVDDYHNGSAQGVDPAGRQRWGDYSIVSLDPTNKQAFWVTGEYALEFNNAAGGHPGGSGFGRWGTFISQVFVAGVPEPSSWALMIAGFGLTGAAMRRRRQVSVTTA
jgi:hypothetical protein